MQNTDREPLRVPQMAETGYYQCLKTQSGSVWVQCQAPPPLSAALSFPSLATCLIPNNLASEEKARGSWVDILRHEVRRLWKTVIWGPFSLHESVSSSVERRALCKTKGRPEGKILHYSSLLCVTKPHPVFAIQQWRQLMK